MSSSTAYGAVTPSPVYANRTLTVVPPPAALALFATPKTPKSNSSSNTRRQSIELLHSNIRDILEKHSSKRIVFVLPPKERMKVEMPGLAYSSCATASSAIRLFDAATVDGTNDASTLNAFDFLSQLSRIVWI